MSNDIPSVISAARIFLGKECWGDNICCSCGKISAKNPAKKALKKTFTDFVQFIQNPSTYVCDSCLELYEDRNLRFKPIFSDTQGSYRIPERPEILQIIRNPPEKFILSVPYSYKKHHWLYAGLSTRKKAYIGTDDRTVIIDYSKVDIETVTDKITDCLCYGVPRTELILGIYSVFTLSKFGFIERLENNLFAPIRQSGLIELIVKFSPAVAAKDKKIYENKEENGMLTNAEINAVNLLGFIASGSAYRAKNGMQFWDGFFERRINRFKHLNAHEFVSKLAEAVGTNHNSVYQQMIKEISEEDLDEIMTTIRKETHLLVSIVYSERSK